MNSDILNDAIDAASRFMGLANRVKDETQVHNKTAKVPVDLLTGTKTTGALRRASIELTRVLAEMRKP